MRVPEKQAVVERLAGKLGEARAIYLTDFTGLDVKKLTDLRARLRKAGVDYLVVKNTLAQRALGQLDFPELDRFLQGPTGLVIGKSDPITPAKVLEEFARDHDSRPAVKAGVVERRAVTPADISRLARLPPREQLLAELGGALASPLAQLAFLLQGRLAEFVGLLEALRAQRENA